MRVRSSDGRLVSGNDKYVNEGMMRFVSGQYAPFMKASAMIGYVFDGQKSKARAGVEKYIQKKAKLLKLLDPLQLTRSPILNEKIVDETRHDLERRVFTLYHIFLAA